MEINPKDIILTPEAAEIHNYIKNPDDETKQRLIAKYEPILAETIRAVIEEINTAKTDPALKQAFEYDDRDARGELETLEITFREYINSPGRQLSADILLKIGKHKLDRPLTFLQILKYRQNKPGKRVTGKMADIIISITKQIHKETQIPRSLLNEIAITIGRHAMTQLFTAYQHEPYLEARRRAAKAAADQNAIIDRTREAQPEKEDLDLIISLNQEAIDQTIKELSDSMNVQFKLFEETGIPQRIEQLMIELYPEMEQAPTISEITGPHDIYYPFNLPSTAAGRVTHMLLNNPLSMRTTKQKEITRRQDPLTGKPSINYKTENNDITFTISNELSSVTNGVKLFEFFQQKANEQHWPEKGASFNLQELVDVGIYSNKDSAYKGLTRSVSRMQDIDIGGTVTGYEGRKRKKIANIGGALISWRQITYNQCFIKLAPIFSAGYIAYIPITDPNFYRLPTNANMLYAYIMHCARLSNNAQNISKNGYFKLSMDAISCHLGLPKIEEAGRDPKRLIVDQIEKALGEIMDSAGTDGMKIEIVTPYDEDKPRPPVADYLRGYIKVTLDDTATEIITNRAEKRSEEISKVIKHNAERKKTKNRA